VTGYRPGATEGVCCACAEVSIVVATMYHSCGQGDQLKVIEKVCKCNISRQAPNSDRRRARDLMLQMILFGETPLLHRMSLIACP
jgi:hypothetical protein